MNRSEGTSSQCPEPDRLSPGETPMSPHWLRSGAAMASDSLNHSSSLEEWVCRRNIDRFNRQLAVETSSQLRRQLEYLIAAEKQKLQTMQSGRQ